MKPYYNLIPIDKIYSNEEFYVRDYEKDNIDELAESIREIGLIEPIIVRKRNMGYVIVCGERRFRACQKIKLQKIPAVVSFYTPLQYNTLNFSDNLHSKRINFLEKLSSVKMFMDKWNLNERECAETLKINRTCVRDILQFSKLSENDRAIIEKNHVPEEQVRIALQIKSQSKREAFIKYIAKKKLGIAQTKQLYDKMIHPKKERVIKSSITPDSRLLINSLNKTVKSMKNSGVELEYTINDNQNEINCILNIQKPVLVAKTK